ncbi:MAG: RidA family protein [Candidatus Latescibacterota bacterium]
MRYGIMSALLGAALAGCLVTSSFAQAVKTFYPAEARSKLYSSGIMVDKTFFVAGAGSAIPGGGQHETFPEQVKQCLDNIRRTLNMAGLDYEHVVKAWVMLDDLNNYQAMNDVFKEVFPNNPPARTTLGINTIPQGNHIEITVIAHADLSEKKVIGSVPAGMPFSQGILAGNTFYFSVNSIIPGGGGVPATFQEEARQCLKNAGEVLKKAGLDYRHVVWSNVYLDKYDNFKPLNKIYNEFFRKGDEPARGNVTVNALPGGAHVEMTFIATTDLASRKVVKKGGKKPGPKEMYAAASPAVWAGDMLYVSAQYGGKGAIEDQFDKVMKSHVDILKQAGLGTKDIVSANAFLRDIKDYDALNKVYPNYFTEGRPGVRTCFMPFGAGEPNDTLVRAYFFAARTK